MERRLNMAAVAAQEADGVSPIKAPKVSKTSKPLKPLKIDKPLMIKTSSKASGSKSSDPKPSASPRIPLVCIVCPNTPRFSDLSHLLTHLSSKGHLQTQNDVRIRANDDLAASEAITTYDKWYKDNGIERMLAERLRAKDEKAKGTARSGQPISQSLKRKKAHSILVKREADHVSMFTPPPTGRLLGQQQAITYYGDRDDVSASTPTDDATEWASDDLEAARLKGTVWPGMGIFDAATPDQKKQRNQRKDASVVRKMELSSQAITTTEMVANLDLEFERTRDVYDAPSVEGTPVAKKPRRRQRRSRAAEEDDNASEVVVKEEPTDEATPQASPASAMQPKNSLYKQEEMPELNIQSLSEKFEVTSDNASSADGDAETSAYAELDVQLDESHVDDEPHFSQYPPHRHFTIPAQDSADVFHDGIAATNKFPGAMEDEIRFDVRNRMPLRSMNANSNLSMASPTPAAKQLPRRMFTGKENNHVLQEQKMAGGDYFGGGNAHLNQAGMTNVNTFNPNFYQGYVPDILTHFNPVPWPQPISRPTHHGFNPINANHNQQQMFYHQAMPMTNTFGTSDHNHAQDAGMYGDRV
ncbi:hypothetical protein CORC01_05665 [Colletotrichum orchidophilum]|uniref:Uncharacterized protein n=1 Tax=Colletotrichum orchidophilum TaxID=1209926 RepID=A0A1G4BCA0_9PEZI|nr:uncharacterized protein CORC01_05665 [Colletotrichum orchidophilum]OHE98975.1 hypothetical protein CORC01_05665 [Colletotrichum orchidophilum]